MTTNEIITLILSGTSVVIAGTALWTADTRSSELKQKILKYSVDSSTAGGDFSGPGDENKAATYSVSRDIEIDVVNDGSLPVGGVTLSVLAEGDFEPAPKVTVILKPAVDREIAQQDNATIVRLRNPLGPKEHVFASVTLTKIVPAKTGFYEALKLRQAYVDSEIGAGILVASLAQHR